MFFLCSEYPSVDLYDRDVMKILGRVRQSARVKLNTAQLLPHIKSHYYLLTDGEIADILDDSLTPQEQTLRFIDYLVFKGSYGLGCLYFSLVETSEEMYGLPTHFQLSCELKQASKTWTERVKKSNKFNCGCATAISMVMVAIAIDVVIVAMAIVFRFL